VLLDDVHDASRHAGDVADTGPARPRHGQTDSGGHHEEVRTRGAVPDRVAERLAASEAESLGVVRRTLLVVGCESQLANLFC